MAGARKLSRMFKRLISSENARQFGGSGNCDAKPFVDIPCLEGNSFLGSLPILVKKENAERLHIFHRKLQRQLGDIYRLRMPGKSNDILCLANPALVKVLLSHDGTTPYIPVFENIEQIRTKVQGFKTAGSLSQGSNWLAYRRSVQQDLLRPKTALHYLPDLNRVIDKVIETLEGRLDASRKITDLNRLMQEYSLESLGVMYLGKRLGVLDGSPIGMKTFDACNAHFETFFLTTLIPYPILRWTPIFKKLVNAWQTITELVRDRLSEIKLEAKASMASTEPNAVLGQLMKRLGPDSEFLVQTGIDGFVAGIDTTSGTASFLLYNLAVNPEAQERLYKELKECMGDSTDITEENLAKMSYLKACQLESQRLLPVVFSLARKTQKDITVGGYSVPSGTKVLCLNHLISSDERYFPEPEKYLPERWLRSCPHQRIEPFSNLPFGQGPRACIGQRFAKVELHALAARLVLEYRLEYDGPTVDVLHQGIGIPDKDVRIKFSRRTD